MSGADGFDVVVVTVSTEASRRWWTRRLHAGRVAGERARFAVVVEPWPAGTAGGTLLALRRAGDDLGLDLLAPSDRAVAVVHAAGAGTRLEPLTSAEGDKPRVRLPGVVSIEGRDEPITLLEAVIRSTGAWGPPHRGRVTVWWGDQLFVSTPPPPPTAPCEILVRPLPGADAATWEAHHLDHYGVVALDAPVAHVEKADRATFVAAVGREPSRVGLSLGAFSADPALLADLLNASAEALAARRRTGTDRHWWMPLTLSADGYARASGLPQDEARAWHAHLAPIRDRFGPVLGARVLDGPWWDFGTLPHWTRNVRRVVDDDDEARALRALLGCERLPPGHPLDPDGESVVVASRVGAGRLRRSVVVGCDLDEADLHDAIRFGQAGPHDHGGGLRYRSPGSPPERISARS